MTSVLKRALRAYVRAPEASAAVEFALVSTPFFALLGSTVQIGFLMWAGQNLDYMAQQVGRQILTGEFQMANTGNTDTANLLGKLKAIACGNGSNIVYDCSTLRVDVALAQSFATGVPSSPLDSSTQDWSAGFGSNYACAPPGTIVVVRVALKFTLAFGYITGTFGDFYDGSKLLQSAIAFRTEPYSTNNNAC